MKLELVGIMRGTMFICQKIFSLLIKYVLLGLRSSRKKMTDLGTKVLGKMLICKERFFFKRKARLEKAQVF